MVTKTRPVAPARGRIVAANFDIKAWHQQIRIKRTAVTGRQKSLHRRSFDEAVQLMIDNANLSAIAWEVTNIKLESSVQTLYSSIYGLFPNKKVRETPFTVELDKKRNILCLSRRVLPAVNASAATIAVVNRKLSPFDNDRVQYLKSY